MSHMQKTEVSGLFGKNFECVTYSQGRYDAHLKYCSTFYYLALGYIWETEITSRKYLKYSGLCFPCNL